MKRKIWLFVNAILAALLCTVLSSGVSFSSSLSHMSPGESGSFPASGEAKKLSSPPTNMALMERLAAIVAEDLLENMPVLEGATVQVANLSANEANWLLEETLANSLKKKGTNISIVLIHADSSSAKGNPLQNFTSSNGSGAELRLEYRIVEMGLEYARTWKKVLIAGRMVERVARANVHARLLKNSTGELLWTGSDEKQLRDVVSVSVLPAVEGKSFPFTKPTLQKKGIGRFLEPLLVSAIVVGLVSLFYSAKG